MLRSKKEDEEEKRETLEREKEKKRLKEEEKESCQVSLRWILEVSELYLLRKIGNKEAPPIEAQSSWGEQRRESSCSFESNQREQLPNSSGSKAYKLQDYSSCLDPNPSRVTKWNKGKESTRVGPTDKFEQSKKENYPPTSLVTSALYLLCVGEGLTLYM